MVREAARANGPFLATHRGACYIGTNEHKSNREVSLDKKNTSLDFFLFLRGTLVLGRLNT